MAAFRGLVRALPLGVLPRSGCVGALIVLVACGRPSRPAEAPADPETVVVSKAEPPSSCKAITTVWSENDEGYWVLRGEAAKRGANYVVLDLAELRPKFISFVTRVTGRAFACPAKVPVSSEAASASAAPPGTAAISGGPAPLPAPAAGCSPPCSPGYECSAGLCAPLCNPACAASDVCAPDRVCRPRAVQ